MNTIFKTGIVLTVFLLAIASVSFALDAVTTLQDADYTSVTEYDLDTDGDATNDSDTLIVDFQEGVYWDTTWLSWMCFCSTPDATATITSSVGDSVTVALPMYSQSATIEDQTVADKFRNSPAITIKLATSASPNTGDSVLEVVSTDTITATARFGTCEVATDTATLSAIASTGVILLTNLSDFSAAATSFIPGTDSIYVQVTDADQNTKAYAPADTVSVTLTTSAGDSETITLTEIDVNDTVFRSAGMSVTPSAVVAGDGELQVSPTGGTNNITATYTDGTKTASTISVFDNLLVSADSPQTAGTPFALTITARDSSGNTLTGYSDTVTLSTNYISPTSGTSAISPTSVPASNFSNGVATVNVTYADAGTITITATATDDKTGTSGNILVLPDNFLVESTGGTTQVVGRAFNVRVTARNSSNSTTPNYNRNVSLTVSNVTPTGTSPTISTTTISGSSFSSGIYTVSMTYNKWGTAKITATDSGYSTATGKTSAAINFYPNSFTLSVASPPVARSKFYLKEEFAVSVTALDYNDATITNYGGTITFTSVDDVDLPDDYTFSSSDDNGAKTFTISGTEEKTFTLNIEDTSYSDATGESDNISLMYGKIKVNDVAGRIGTLSTTVEIVDKSGNVITDDDSTTFVVALLESKATGASANTATVVSDAAVSGGKATISVTDTELETVTVTPDSTPYLEPESGTVTFSETAVGGGGARRIGQDTRILYWRELKKDEE